MKYEMKRETIIILFVAVLVIGFVAGRMSTGGTATAEPVAVATSAPAGPATAAPAAAVKAAAPGTPTPAQPVAALSSQPPAAVVVPDKVWKVKLAGNDPSKGPKDASVTAVVFSAFGSQECIDFKPAVDQLIADYGDKIRIVFKQKVFDAPHPDALAAAEAALSAHAQGKFWEYHDKLMDESKFNLDRGELERQAEAIGLDMARFRKDLDTHAHRTQALRDGLGAFEVGAHSFPNVLVNGVRMKKPKNWDSLKAVVDAQIVKADALVAKGTPAIRVYDTLTASGKIFEQVTAPVSGISDGNSPFIGPKDAQITLVVFEDFECPFCSKANGNLKAFAERFPKKVKLVFKHFPLTSLHANAQLASEAAVEAHTQGKFWAYHDKLFANQKALTRADLDGYAKEIGLDMAKFTAALDGGTHKAAVARDASEGRRVQVSGTPAVFLNGRKYQGPRGFNPDGLEGVARVSLGLK